MRRWWPFGRRPAAETRLDAPVVSAPAALATPPQSEPAAPPEPPSVTPAAERLFRVLSARDHRPPFSFSLGLAPAGLPELIVFGLRETIAHSLLNHVARDLVSGKELEPGRSYEDYLVGYPVRFRRAPSSGEYAQYAFIGASAARSPMPAVGTYDVLQVVWSDHSRRFPDEPGYNGELQPLL